MQQNTSGKAYQAEGAAFTKTQRPLGGEKEGCCLFIQLLSTEQLLRDSTCPHGAPHPVGDKSKLAMSPQRDWRLWEPKEEPKPTWMLASPPGTG